MKRENLDEFGDASTRLCDFNSPMEDTLLQARLILLTLTEGEGSGTFLPYSGYHVTMVSDPVEFARMAEVDSFDLVIIRSTDDLLMVREAIECVRTKDVSIPIVVISDQLEDADLVQCLDSGADEYLPRTVSGVAFQARLRSLLRRGHRPLMDTPCVTHYNYTFHKRTYDVMVRDAKISLTEKEFKLAYFLFRNLGRVVSRNHMSLAVWGRKIVGESRSLDTHMSRIRRKLMLYPENGFRLISVYTQGYRLEYVGDALADGER